MRLLLKCESDSLDNLSLSAETIFVGHEPSSCQFLLDKNRWSMVAPLHSKFRIINGVCYLFALDAESATYVDEKKITRPTPVVIGSRIRFGPGGPQFRLLNVETLSIASSEAVFPVPRSRLVSSLRVEEGTAHSNEKRAPVKLAYIEITGHNSANVRRFDLNKDVVQIGRAPGLDIVFDASSSFISRRHAEIIRTAHQYVLIDLNSFNGTLLNGQRITGPSFLRNGDTIRLGIKGPVLNFHQEGLSLKPPKPVSAVDSQSDAAADGPFRHGGVSTQEHSDVDDQVPLYVLPFDGRNNYFIGRGPDCYVTLDSLQISQQHAVLTVFNKRIFLEDTGSSNGTFIDGLRLMGKMEVGPQNVIQVGSFSLRVHLRRGIEVYEPHAQMRIDCIGVTRIEKRANPPMLLDDISFTIRPNEFVGLLGPSGAGKTTLLKALNGMRRATSGRVLINNLDLYQHLNGLKKSIGYVPQDDIIHKELTVYRTLYYVARLRLSKDASEEQIITTIDDVLDVTGLTERRNARVTDLSGGQRKRVSVAVELLTKPSVIFLDEPTSGLDPVSEEQIMRLFRQLATDGRTVVLTTHNIESVKLFDKVVILMRGKLVFYGAPVEALKHVNAASFKELYERLEEPIARRMAVGATRQPSNREFRLAQVRERVAELWKDRFRRTAQYEHNVSKPLSKLPSSKSTRVGRRSPFNFKQVLAQLPVLCQRYSEILRSDRLNLWVLFMQAPAIAVMTWLAVPANMPRDFAYFILSLVPLWFGTSIAAREIVRERAIYRRERMVNLRILSYLGSKLAVLSILVSLQCLLLFGTLKLFTLVKLFPLQTLLGGSPQLLMMILTGMVGIAMGLLVSASVKTSELATSFVPLLLIPQILFCGLAGVPQGATKAIGALLPATWSFDQMKRLSARDVDVLQGRDEGAQPAYNQEGRGLFKQIEYQNERVREQKEKEIADYKSKYEEKLKRLRQETEKSQRMSRKSVQRGQPAELEVESPPENKATFLSVPHDKSNYVEFLHPWGARWLNPVILILMFLICISVTGGILRAQDIA